MEKERLSFQDLLELATPNIHQIMPPSSRKNSSKRRILEKPSIPILPQEIPNFEEKAELVWERIYCRSREELGNGIVVLLKDVMRIQKSENSLLMCKLHKRFGLQTNILGATRKSGKNY